MITAAERTKTRHLRLIAAGLCVKCQKPRDGRSKWRCKACLRKLADEQKVREKVRAYYYGPKEHMPAADLPSTLDLSGDDEARYNEIRRRKSAGGC
jgi:hypothetical protein